MMMKGIWFNRYVKGNTGLKKLHHRNRFQLTLKTSTGRIENSAIKTLLYIVIHQKRSSYAMAQR
jgi:hypothetical protein